MNVGPTTILDVPAKVEELSVCTLFVSADASVDGSDNAVGHLSMLSEWWRPDRFSPSSVAANVSEFIRSLYQSASNLAIPKLPDVGRDA